MYQHLSHLSLLLLLLCHIFFFFMFTSGCQINNTWFRPGRGGCLKPKIWHPLVFVLVAGDIVDGLGCREWWWFGWQGCQDCGFLILRLRRLPLLRHLHVETYLTLLCLGVEGEGVQPRKWKWKSALATRWLQRPETRRGSNQPPNSITDMFNAGQVRVSSNPFGFL